MSRGSQGQGKKDREAEEAEMDNEKTRERFK
jgi:hypothetical protein